MLTPKVTELTRAGQAWVATAAPRPLPQSQLAAARA
jgi:hypothetical protein